MTLLIGACLAFLITHLGVSATPLRGPAVALLGENGYLGAHSLLALLTLGGMVHVYGAVPHTDFIWAPSVIAAKANKTIMLLAIAFIVLGVMTKNPTAMKMEGAISDGARGVLKITRHPIQWGIMLFATGHIIANGDIASIVMFGTLALVSCLGTLAMDAKKRALDDPQWRSFYDATSNVPFIALISGKSRFSSADINYLALGVGVF